MVTLLTLEARIHLGQDEDLQKKVADYMGMHVDGVKTALVRNSKSLTTYRVVMAVAESMQRTPEEILEESVN